MLYQLAFTLLFSFIINHQGMAEDHKAWALQQQARSQAMIKSYEQEALARKKQKAPILGSILKSVPRSIKACRANQSLPCSKKPILEPTQDATVYIFVSFSMPKETLKTLAYEAEKQKGILVIRGLVDNSFIKTAKVMQEMEVGVILDPTLFKEYDIKVVPTFVQKHKNAYQRIAGNVSLSYALEVFTREKVEDETLKDEKVIDKKTSGEGDQ